MKVRGRACAQGFEILFAHFNKYRGLILGRGSVPVPSSYAVKSSGLGVRELKITSLGFGVRELKTRTKNAHSSHIKVGRFVRNPPVQYRLKEPLSGNTRYHWEKI